MDIRELRAAAARFQKKLESVKRANQSTDFDWYPYDSFAVFPVLEKMLSEDRRDLISLAGASPILDIGCGDGDLSFFFESEGCRVLALDNPGPNFNRTRGFESLRTALQSSVELQICDLDTGLQFDGRTFGFALFLGVLYHLKNPFGVLETLAKHVRYCLLSTRVAQVTARGTSVENDPIAYLVDPLEANHDSSNYWIFSDAGLRRILYRTGWEVCDFATTGFKSGSSPADQDRDQRAFCLIRSNMPDPWTDVDLDGGWHGMEDGSWRWTERVFSVKMKRPAGATSKLRFQFRLHDSIFSALGSVGLHAIVNSQELLACEYNSPGEHTYEQQLPPGSGEDLNIRFELDKAFGPTLSDRRELGLQVIFWGYDQPQPRPLHPITIVE